MCLVQLLSLNLLACLGLCQPRLSPGFCLPLLLFATAQHLALPHVGLLLPLCVTRTCSPLLCTLCPMLCCASCRSLALVAAPPAAHAAQ